MDSLDATQHQKGGSWSSAAPWFSPSRLSTQECHRFITAASPARDSRLVSIAHGCPPFLRVAPWVVSGVVSNGIANHYRCLPCRTENLVGRGDLVQYRVRTSRLPPRHHESKDSTTAPRHRRSTHDHTRSVCNAAQAARFGFVRPGAEGRNRASLAVKLSYPA
jgi:hypothetical protein